MFVTIGPDGEPRQVYTDREQADAYALKFGLSVQVVMPEYQHRGAVDAETLERHRWALDEAVRFMTDKRGNPDAIKALLALAEWGQ
jgi:hypothetical protein